MKPKTTTAKQKSLTMLNCLERLVLLQLLANYKEGNFITFKTLGELRLKIGFTAKDIADFELKEENNLTMWNMKGEAPVGFDLLDHEKDLIKKQLVQLDEASKLEQKHLSLYEKFV